MAEVLGNELGSISDSEFENSLDADSIGSSPCVDGISLPPTKRKRLTSLVWTCFDKCVEKNQDGSDIVDANGNKSMKAVCKTCEMKMVFGGTHGTSHLNRHMKRCIKRTSNVASQPIVGRTDDGEVYHFSFNQKVARCATVRYFVTAEIPFNEVDQPAFHKWIRDAFGPQFKPPCRVTLRNDAVKIFGEDKAKLKVLLANVPEKICLTTDLWTSIQRLSYLCITAHFISSDWTIHHRIITFYALSSPHTGRVIGEAIHSQLLEWGIQRKIGTLSLDNASNNDSAISYLKDKLFGDDTLSRSLFQLRCTAHVMNLVVNDRLDHVKLALKNIRDSVQHVGCTPARLQRFHATSKDLNIKEKTLPSGAVTRRDSTYMMLEVAIPYETAFDHFFCSNDFAHVPTPNDWKNARVTRDFLKILCETTKLFSGSNYVTSSTFCYQLSKIALCLNKYANEPSFKPMYTSMKAKYDKYWKQVPLVLGLASCMDPRYKMYALDLCLDLNSDPQPSPQPPPTPHNQFISFQAQLAQMQPSFGPTQPQIAPESILSEKEKRLMPYQNALSELFETYQKKYGADSAKHNDGESDMGDDDMVFALLTQRREASIQSCKSDLQRYLDQPAIRVNNKEFDVLKWWRMQEATYPVLSVMARDLLAIPISSVPSECAFSGGSCVVCKNGSCLLPETVETLICLEDWFKAEDGMQDGGEKDIEQLMAGLLL